MQTARANLYEFGDFQLDTGKRLLRRLDGTPVPLTSRVFDTLLYMVRHHDAVLDKERIMEAVWPNSIVEENNLAQAISKLRQVFGETPGSHSYIVTIPGRGYRFVAEVNSDDHSHDVESQIPSPNSQMQQTRMPLQKSPIQRFPDSPFPTLSEGCRQDSLAMGAGFLAVAIVGIAMLFFVGYRAPENFIRWRWHSNCTVASQKHRRFTVRQSQRRKTKRLFRRGRTR